MKKALDGAVADIASSVPGLRAVVLSAAPDGLIAWCWSREAKVEVALGFAALDRAATACLDGLGSSYRERSMLLCSEDARIVSWPLHDEEAEQSAARPDSRLVVTVLFGGGLQTGMTMVYGARVRARIRELLDGEVMRSAAALRARLCRVLRTSERPCETLRAIAASTELELRHLGRIDRLEPSERSRLAVELTRRAEAGEGPRSREST